MKKPDPKLIESMAMRYRHDFSFMDERTQNAIRTMMSQLWEEVVGQGFYKEEPKKNEEILIRIYKGDEVNSLLAASLRFLTKEQLITLRDSLTERIPKPAEPDKNAECCGGYCSTFGEECVLEEKNKNLD